MLKIGTNVNLKYIVESEDRVISVPFEAIYKNDDGNSAVLCVTENNDSTCFISEQLVETGAENDLYTIISGMGIDEGTKIIREADLYKQYINQTISIGEKDSASDRATPFGK